jgi:NAD(P)-dependent dehydrogenase (short-subunit alcohol dehydrogenase family)
MINAAGAPVPELATLRGRVVLITGGSRGLGAAVAATLGAAGMRVVLTDIAVQRVLDFAAVLAEQDIDAIALPLDVSDPVQCAQAIDRVAQRFGRLDALVNNAAVDISAPTNELSAADWQRIVASNLNAPYMLSNHAVALMAAQRDGHIVNITSAETDRARHSASAHHATPWGTPRPRHALHGELRAQGIKVTAVEAGGHRGPFPTERHAPATQTRKRQHLLRLAQVVRFVLQQPAAAG